MKALLRRSSNKQYTGTTIADTEYERLIAEGADQKTAAKQAQLKTGISLISGRPMKSRGYN